MNAERFTTIGVIASVVLHAAAAIVLRSRSETIAPAPVPSVVRFEMFEPEKKLPTPEPKTQGTLPAKLGARPIPRAEPPSTKLPTPTPSENTPPQALDLGGVTLTNEGAGAGFGIDLRPAAGSAPAPKTKLALSPKKTRPSEPAVVGARDLSKPPRAPALDGALRNHYPPEARRRGIGGEAVVRARVDSDGRIRACNVISESDGGFGAACRSTVLGSSWSPPLDRDGRPVATYVRYTCRFRIDG